MIKRKVWLPAALPVIWMASAGYAQTLGNQALSGKYYFRHVLLAAAAASPVRLTDSRTLTGAITFDGAGGYTFTGQQITGGSPAVPANGSGKYSIDAGGFVQLDNPQWIGAKLNARYSSEALLGSTTEGGDTIYDLFAAIPAPASGAALAGPYTAVSLEFPGGSIANVRASRFSISAQAGGALATFTATGHAVNLGGRWQSQQVSAATYTMAADGTGTLSLGAATNSQLLSGTRAIYLSASGNVILGGSTAAGGHDLLIGVKAMSGASNASWNATFWGAGLRVDSTAAMGYAGSVAARGQGKLTWTKRIKALGAGQIDFTGINAYSLSADGAGTVDLTMAGLGASGRAFVGAAISDVDPNAYEIYFGVQVPSLSGPGVFLHPLGVANAASFAPPGNPIAPGEFVALFGTGLAAGNRTASPPYPTTLNNVTVQVNGRAAPIYFVSPGQINFLVPYATTGPTATIVVTNNNVASNAVTVPVAATSPGVFSLDQSGSGPGAILHADYSVVNAGNPAVAGETVLVFLTGMGTVTPNLDDGTAGLASTLYRSASDVTVLAAGKTAAVKFNGLAPGFPGLYQLNVTLPSALRVSGILPLAIQTANGYHDQVDVPMR